MSNILAWTGIALALVAILPALLRKMPLTWCLLVASNVLMAISSALDGNLGWVLWSTVLAVWCAFGVYTRLRTPQEDAS